MDDLKLQMDFAIVTGVKCIIMCKCKTTGNVLHLVNL